MRGTFANIRIKNFIMQRDDGAVPEGGMTKVWPQGEPMSIYDAAMRYGEAGTPLVIFAGAEYGNGSSRDWAAKGTKLLGVARGDRRKLRAHPSLQPRRHGRAAADLRARHDVEHAEAQRQRDGDDLRAGRDAASAPEDGDA